MDFLHQVIDLFLHLDEHLTQVIAHYGTVTYAILFAIVFAETGLVVTPFLPGDSLLFAAATFAAVGTLNIWVLIVLFFIAAVAGDAVNYAIGKHIGPKVFTKDTGIFLNRKHLLKTEQFYEKHGGKTIIIARFIPIVRTFAPFVAGIGSMQYTTFFMYNIVGAALWVGLFCVGGYVFGNIPVVKHNFEFVIFGIIGISLLPPIIEFIRGKLKNERHE